MRRTCILIVVLLSLLVPAATPGVSAADERCFPETGFCLSGRLREFWERQGGLPVFGFPISAMRSEAGPVGPISVQMFERARLELHPENRRPYDVLLGRLGADGMAQAGVPASPPETPQAGCRFFAETGLNVCPPFLNAWRRYGLDLGQPGISAAESLALFGLPLTAPQPMRLSNGQTYTVQWFERARFEDHGPNGVLFGLLGSEQNQNLRPQLPAHSLEAGGFIKVSGTQLTRLGKPVTLKGVNYYPQNRPWKAMWNYWEGSQMDRELRQARAGLGINTIRILVPYSWDGARDGEITPMLLDRLRQILQIAGDLEMRVIVTLFDFDESFPPPDSPGEGRHFAYLRTLIGNFAGDDRILGWDIHNEPDHYGPWNSASGQVLMWMGRISDEIRRLAPNHLVTVGMGKYQNFLAVGPDGRRPIDYIDFLSLHNYNSLDMARQIDELRRATDKPIVVGEFGWPSGPACSTPGFTEERQAQVYREAIDGAQGRTAGMIAWTLRDYDSGPSVRWDTREEHYGLYRPDGSPKPAAQVFAAYAATPLPSTVRIPTSLTDTNYGLPGGPGGPLLDDGNRYYVKRNFRRAWLLLGGEISFGRPLTEAFVNPDDGKVIQYFEGGVFRLFTDVVVDPSLPAEQQFFLVQQAIRPVSIGKEYVLGGLPKVDTTLLGDRGYSVARPFRSFYTDIAGGWRLGIPLSPELTEEINGIPRTVQYFEHGRLQINPETRQPEIGGLGRWALTERCRSMGQATP